MDRYVTPEQLVQVAGKWQACRAAVAIEQASLWMLEPATCSHCDSATTSASVAFPADVAEAAPSPSPQAGSGSKKASKKKKKQEQGVESPVPAAAVLTLPPARGFVEVCGIELACSQDPDARDATAAASTSGRAMMTPGGSRTSSAAAPLQQQQQQPLFVAVPSARRNLEACSLVLCAGRPLLMEGPPGSGKTRLVDQVWSVECGPSCLSWFYESCSP